jgi:2',3'-cyclic-nucleotide 2'-phosphodiesterase (5'-nucleotidase family)
MKRTLLLIICLLVFSLAEAERREVHILSVNDVHATISEFPQLAALIDSLRTADPSLLVFSAGDNRTGNPLNDKYDIPAYPMVALMNQVGFNGSALGNHEFDVHSLARLIGLSNFRYICANLWAEESSGIKTVPYQVFDAGGVKVGVIGVIQLGAHGLPSTHPDNLRGLSFTPAMETIGQYEWLREQCDVVILLSHLGYEDDIEMAKIFPWIDQIIGGHTHTQLKGNERVNGVLITQNKNKFGRVTYTTLTVDSGRVVDKRAEYIDIKNYPKKSKLVEAMVRFFSDDPKFQQVVAQAEAPFDSKEELGCMMCDAFMEAYDADIAVENPGGVRIDRLPAGDITVLNILEMDPFDNNAVVLELTGEQLLRMMLTYCSGRSHSFPFVRGILCELTVEPNNPNRIKSARLLTMDGKKLDMKRRYRVVTNNYITATSKLPEGVAQVQNVQTTDIVMRFLEKHKKVNYQGVRCLIVK